MALSLSLEDILVRAPTEAAAFAGGLAIHPALAPLLRDLENFTWSEHPDKALDLLTAAAVAAEDVAQYDTMAQEAAYGGYNGDRFKWAYGETLNAPGLGPLFELWRRKLISDGDFVHGLRKAKLEGRWDGPLEGLHDTLLSSAELGNLQQQGFIDAARANAEGGLQGVTEERQQLRFEASGLPPGVETALQMLRRNIIDTGTFAQIVREGHTKTKYTDVLLALRQPILSASEYARLHLKGHITVQEMNAGGALSGYSAEQMNLMYLAMGRPASPGYMWTAAARGIDGPAGRPVDQEQFQTAIAQSDIRPEYGPMLWEIRYLYPSLFQLNRLVTGSVIDSATGADWARKARYAPEVVTALEQSWAGGATATTDPHVSKAQTQLWTRLHTSYLAGEISEADARTELPFAGVSAAGIDGVVTTWNHERDVERKQLTPTQVKKAYANGVTNPATGQPWTRDDALAALIGRGYSPNDANTFLDL